MELVLGFIAIVVLPVALALWGAEVLDRLRKRGTK